MSSAHSAGAAGQDGDDGAAGDFAAPARPPGILAPVVMAEPTNYPSAKARLLWTIGAALFWAFPVAGLLVWGFVASAWSTWPFQAAAAAVVVFAATNIAVVPAWRWRVHRWEVGAEAVYTRTGWFTQERRIAPITRIQTVDTARGPLDRMLGLSTVTVTTASAAGPVTIHALDQAVADQVVAELTAIAARNKGDAT